MRTIQLWLKRITQFGLILMMGASMSACAATSWKEEVLLHDGSKIIVERTVERGGRHEIGQQPPYKAQSLSFAMPNTRQDVVWEDKFSEDVGSANFLPMLVDIRNGAAYLVAYPMGCLSYNKWGRPNPPYVVFKYRDSEWQRIPLQELPAEIKTPNLIFSDPDNAMKKVGKSLIPADAIQQIISRYRQPEYRTILREAYQGAEAGCSEMIKVNDGWEGLGFFKLQTSYEACSKYCDRKGVNQKNCPCNKLFQGAK